MIYLDNHATTACDPQVVEAMVPYFSSLFGNSSSSHELGQRAAESIDRSKDQMARLLNCSPTEITFTSGATESNNLAIFGAARKFQQLRGKRKKLITTKIEHKAVLAPFDQLEREGWQITFLPIDRFGQIDLNQAERIISDEAFLISVQLANSEIGTIQPLSVISEIAHQHGALVHCDASQAVGRIPINVDVLGFDFLSMSGHKIHAPKGIGALWIKSGFEKCVSPIMYGGQANGIRPGTQPVPLIVGLGKACEIISKNFDEEYNRISQMRDYFESILLSNISEITINGARSNRLSNNSNITFPRVDAEALLSNLPEILASTNSACESGSVEPSRVLTAIGLSPEQAFQTIRFGLGRFNTTKEIEEAATEIIFTYRKLRNQF